LLGHLCAGFSQDAGAVVTALNAHAWPPKDTPSISAAPVRYACVFEVLHDDKNYYDGLGKSKASVDKKLPPLCAEESMKPDLIGEFDYIVGMGKL
ncbi:MAG: hypothetical protein LBP51_04990, partial [Deferribacteraceae bacterium]|nr:hypothetical protein [Deferribacteraceae bacterium]